MKNSKIIIEEILSQYKNILGADFNTYRNHVHRVFALCLKIDPVGQNEEKYAIASAFHDLGIWTNDTFDYLEPSIALASNYLDQIGRKNWQEEISLIIDMHHKRSKYIGENEKTVETFRRADWIDVTKGLKLFGIPRVDYIGIKEEYPILGFHKFLVIQTFRNLLKSPFDPLPMFKK